MPTTLTGLLIFVVLLLPGFAYLVGKERAGTERRTSPFRETVAVVSASVTSELAVVTLSWPWWSRALDVDALIGDSSGYVRQRPGLLAAWGIGLLTIATIAAYLATLPLVRRWLPGRYPHPSAVSGWWLLFDTWKLGRTVYVGCALDDGSYVSGLLASFNNSADDSTSRDLILLPPIEYQRPNSSVTTSLKCGAVCVAAARITMMQISYVTPRSATAAEKVRVNAAEEPVRPGSEERAVRVSDPFVPAQAEPPSPVHG